MKTKYVKITDLADVLEIVCLALHTDGEVSAMAGRYTIDCKSIMGVLSLNFSTGVTIEYPSDAHKLDHYLNKFTVSNDDK